MKGNELYERIRQTAVQHGQGPFQTWDELGLWRAIYDETAAQVTEVEAAANYPESLIGLSTDQLRGWVAAQSPGGLLRLYKYLNAMGYRI